jgi:hypothetical protein
MSYQIILCSLAFCLLTSSLCSAQQNEYKKLLSLSYADIDSLMYIEYNKGAFDKAIPYMQAGREKAKTDFGELDSIYSEYNGNLGFFYSNTRKYDKALPILEENLKF